MAGDILLYQADIVPIGDDQRQHLELARDIAERFNSRFGEVFTVPDGVYPEVGARIMSLQDPAAKMGKTGSSEQGTIGLLDEPDAILKKFRTAVTDSGREVRRADDKPGVSNLIDIMSVATGRSPEAIEAEYADARLRHVQARPSARRSSRCSSRSGSATTELRADEGELLRLLALGADKARDGVDADARADVRGDGVRRPVRRTAIIAAAVLALVVVAGVLHYTDAPPVAVFVISGAALGGVAWAIGVATESVGARFGPGVTGVLQSTLGNLPELFIVLFSLSAGELVVAQFSILGSLFANALLVLGLAIVAGAGVGRRRRDAVREAAAERHGDAPAALDLPDRPARPLRPGRRPGERASGRDLGRRRDLPARRLRRVARSATCAPTSRPEQAPEQPTHAVLPFPWALGLLAVAGVVGGARLRVVRRRDRPGRREARDLEGVHGARDRGDRRERGRERRGGPARPEGKVRPRDLGRQELGRPDRVLPVSRSSCSSRCSSRSS